MTRAKEANGRKERGGRTSGAESGRRVVNRQTARKREGLHASRLAFERWVGGADDLQYISCISALSYAIAALSRIEQSESERK